MTALLLALALLLCLPACGSADPACGRYLCVGAEAEGIQMSAALLGEESTVLSLTADGRGTLTRGGAQGGLSWSREGDLLRLDVGGKLYDAELRDGLLLLQSVENVVNLRHNLILSIVCEWFGGQHIGCSSPAAHSFL